LDSEKPSKTRVESSATPIADEADTGEAVPGRVSTCRIRAVDERRFVSELSVMARDTKLLDQTNR